MRTLESLAMMAIGTAIGAVPGPARAQTPTPTAGEWSAYGRDAGGTRYAPLDQITRDNVSTLTLAWTYRTGEIDRARFPTKRDMHFEATPLMVDGTLYLSTPAGRAIALDPATGKARWVYADKTFDIGADWGDYSVRGVSTWVDPKLGARAPCKRRIYLGALDGHIFALDARTGSPCRGSAPGAASTSGAGCTTRRHGSRSTSSPRHRQ